MEYFTLKEMNQSPSCLELKKSITEIVRGFAIIFVILGHILGGTFGLTSTHVTMLLGTGGVNIFLFLSGYGLFESYRVKGLNFRLFWNKKLNKIFIPYGIMTILYYGYLSLMHQQPGRTFLLENILCIDFTRSIDGTMWYMSYILIWYGVFFLVFYFDYNVLFKIGLVWLIGSNFSAYWLHNIFQECSYQFSINAYSFPMGLLAAYIMAYINHNIYITSHVRDVIGYIIAGLSVVVFILGNLQVINVAYWEYGLCEFIILYKFIELLLYKLQIPLKALKYIGQNSFLLYLIEAKFIRIIGGIDLAQHNIWIFSILYFVVMIATVYAFNWTQQTCRRFFSEIKKR